MKIGWAQCDVTPDRPICLRGQFYRRVSQGVRDPLTATALAIEGTAPDGSADCAVIVSCDRVSVPARLQEKVRDAVAARAADLDVCKVFMHATHTHDAPGVAEGPSLPEEPGMMSDVEYTTHLVAQVADAVVRAWQGRKRGRISRAFGHAVVGHNRRAVYMDGTARMYGKTAVEDFSQIEGYEDHSVDMLFTWGARGALTGVLLNVPCPSQVEEHLLEVSADYWHDVRVELRRRHGGKLFVLPQCAPAGDQSPHFLLYAREEEAMRARRGLTERQEIARRIANAVDEEIDGARQAAEADVPVCHTVKTIDLPARLVTDEEAATARSEVERLEAETPADERAASVRDVYLGGYRRVLERHEEQSASSTVPVELHVLRIGEVAMATNPFELFLDFGLRMKARSRAPQTILVQLACDGQGYLPTERAVQGRSYGAEVASNQVGPQGGQVLVDATVEEINRLWPE